MTARRLVVPEEFRATLFWGAETTAGLILERGLEIERGNPAACEASSRRGLTSGQP